MRNLVVFIIATTIVTVLFLSAPVISLAEDFDNYANTECEKFTERWAAFDRIANKKFEEGDYESYKILIYNKHMAHLITSRLSDLSTMNKIIKFIKVEADKSYPASMLRSDIFQLAKLQSNIAQANYNDINSHNYPDDVTKMIKHFSSQLTTSSKGLTDR